MARKVAEPHLKKTQLRKLSERVEPLPSALELAHLTAALVQAGILKQQVINEGWIMGRDVANDALGYWKQCAGVLRITREFEIWGEHESRRTEWRNAFVAKYQKDGRIDVADVVRLAGFERLTLSDEQLRSVEVTESWKKLHPQKRRVAIFKFLTAEPLRKCELITPSCAESRFITMSLARVRPGEADALDRRVSPVRMNNKTREVVGVTNQDGKSPSISDELRHYDERIKRDSIRTEQHPDGSTKTETIKGLDEMAVIRQRQAEYVEKGVPHEVFDKVLDMLQEAKLRLKSSKNSAARKGKKKPVKKDAEGKFVSDGAAKNPSGQYKAKSSR